MAGFREQRVAERFNVSATTSCDFSSPVLDDFDPLRIRNIAVDGIGLLANQELQAGLMLAINLVNPARSFSKTMLVRVVHCTPQVGGSFLIGGTFVTPLAYEELRALVM